jgi:flagellar hook-basal body complex protein FliE
MSMLRVEGSAIGGEASLPATRTAQPAERSSIGEPDGIGRVSFAESLEALVTEANRAGHAASAAANALAKGASDDLHGTMIAAKEAELSLKLVGTVRNKLFDAFQELWRINV